jgi:hypothetical protein
MFHSKGILSWILFAFFAFASAKKHVIKVQVQVPPACVCTAAPPAPAEVILTTVKPGDSPCKCPCERKSITLHKKVYITSCALTETFKTVRQTVTVHGVSTRIVTKHAAEVATVTKDRWSTSHRTSIIPVTVESIKSVMKTIPCTCTVTSTRPIVYTSTREFLCYENKPATNTTYIMETALVPCETTTEIETIYE